MKHVVRGVGWLGWLGCWMELGWSELMRGEGGAGVSDKVDQARVDHTHNPTTHMHEGCMLDEVLCMESGVDDGWLVGRDGWGGWWLDGVDGELMSGMEGWEVVEE